MPIFRLHTTHILHSYAYCTQFSKNNNNGSKQLFPLYVKQSKFSENNTFSLNSINEALLHMENVNLSITLLSCEEIGEKDYKQKKTHQDCCMKIKPGHALGQLISNVSLVLTLTKMKGKELLKGYKVPHLPFDTLLESIYYLFTRLK